MTEITEENTDELIKEEPVNPSLLAYRDFIPSKIKKEIWSQDKLY